MGKLRVIAVPTVLLCLVWLTSFGIAFAQEFTKIVDAYHCARFSNGKQFLVLKPDTGFSLVKNSVVKEKFNQRRRLLVQRKKIIDSAIKSFVQKRINASKLLGSLNKNIKQIFGEEGLPKEIPPGEVEINARNFSTRVQSEIAYLETIRSLISDCESGINPKKGAGTALSPTIEVVAIAHRTGIEGGIVIHTAPQKNEFSTKPGGYNGCLKTISLEGEERSLYTGFGRDSNRCFPGNFDDITPSQCEALIPEGRVGWLIQLREYNFLSLPNATTEQLLDQMRIEVIPTIPAVAIFAITQNISRDASLRVCQAF